MTRRRLARLAIVGAALAFGAVLARAGPEEQMVHYILGDAAPRVEEVDARWALASAAEESLREVSFRYARGHAPRIVTHAPRLAQGDYTVEIDVVADGQRARRVRHVALRGGVTAIDLTTLGAVSSRGPSLDRRLAEPR